MIRGTRRGGIGMVAVVLLDLVFLAALIAVVVVLTR